MARIEIPDGAGRESDRMWAVHAEIGDAAVALRSAVYTANRLPIRVQEAVRYLIADRNQCPICLAARSEEGRAAGLTEEFYELVLRDPGSDAFDEREQLALEYARRFCDDHLSIDDELFDRLRAAFSNVEVFDLCVTVARHLAFGRLTQVLHVDVDCAVHPGLPVS